MPTLGKVQSLYFSLMSPNEIRKLSVLEITESKAGSEYNSLSDPRLGPIDSYSICPTCSQNNLKCTGHFGHIDLAVPIFHPKYFNVVVKILKCICIQCSQPLIPKDRIELSIDIVSSKKASRLDKMVSVCQNIKACYNCGAIANSIKSDNGKIYMIDVIDENGVAKNIVIDAQKAHDILSCMSNESVSLLGFNETYVTSGRYDYTREDIMLNVTMKHRHQIRPEDMIFTALLVPPTCIRPPSFIDGQLFPDDLTEKLNTIIKSNEKLKEDNKLISIVPTRGRKKKGKMSQTEREKEQEKLEMNIAIYLHNKDGSAKAGGGKAKNSARPCKGIGDRIEKKGGHMRENVNSKRNDYSARTVINGDPTLSMQELGVPKEIAEEETVPHIVRPYNLKRVQELIRQGKVNYIYSNRKPQKINLKKIKGGYQNYTITENVYDPSVTVVVEVQMQDGDVVIFNRQPTLRKESMMALKTRVMPEGKTFRFSLALCTAYNADFDGLERIKGFWPSTGGLKRVIPPSIIVV